MNRTRSVIALLLAAVVTLAGLTGCGRLRERATESGETTALSWEAQALQQLGFAPADLRDDPSEDDDSTRPRARHPRLRYVFSHALHGEATVQTEDGLLTVVAQRGTVTQASEESLTVESADGFTLTWAVGDRTVVVVRGMGSEPGSVSVGSEVGVAGVRDGDTVTARLVVVPRS